MERKTREEKKRRKGKKGGGGRWKEVRGGRERESRWGGDGWMILLFVFDLFFIFSFRLDSYHKDQRISNLPPYPPSLARSLGAFTQTAFSDSFVFKIFM